jgi:alpha-D-xyloside xylohydrolase
MTRMVISFLLLMLACTASMAAEGVAQPSRVVVTSPHLRAGEDGDGDRSLTLDGLYYVTADARHELPVSLTAGEAPVEVVSQGRVVRVSLERSGDIFLFAMNAEPADGILRWGVAISATADEYFTGLMERVVDGHQQLSWSPLTREAMNLRGQRVEMIVKPTTSVYAPFYLSSRGYATFVKGTWPGVYDFCADDPERVKIFFEGPCFEMRIYIAEHPLSLVRAHAIKEGPPFLPPRWAYRPWRWRDEHVHVETYYDGTPVTGPFNSQVMEDVLMMRAFGIPCGVYWIDRPWGPGRLGYDDFEIDAQRLPHFVESIEWLGEQGTRMFLWIAPFLQGEMVREGLARGYGLPGQPPQENNYPVVDLTNPEARAFWQAGVAKLLKLGVAGFKLDRGEEGMPEYREIHAFDGRSIREVRNAYPALFIKAAYDVAREHRGMDFVLMPRGAYSGSSPYGVFWGGDIGGTQEGLRASIIAIQRAAVMGYPNWGADTCGYGSDVELEQEVCGRWLGFAAFNPIMEVGPTRNVAFWSLPRTPSYDPVLIAIWRLYARLHDRLADYSYAQAQRAAKDGTPIVRPLFLAEPEAAAAWSSWWTFLYGPDLLVSPIWEKGKRTQEVHLPAGDNWRDAWRPDEVHKGGQTIEVAAELHQVPSSFGSVPT